MGSLAALNYTSWIGGHDFTTDSNELSLEISFEELEDTRYTHSGRSRIAGLEDIELELNGYWEAGQNKVDPAAFGNLGTGQVVTNSPHGTETSVAYMWQGRTFSYQLGDEIGSVLPFELTGSSARGSANRARGAVRGQVAAAVQDVSATGALGSPVNLGDVASGEHLYATFHVLGAGTSITVDVESAPAQAFTSATSRGTIGPLTAIGGTWMTRVAGPITDTWFRFNVTAVTGTFSVAGAIGIK